MSAAPHALLLVVIVASSQRAAADDDATVPELGGHRFVPSSLVAWSFVDTDVASTTTAGIVRPGPAAGRTTARVLGTPEAAFLTAAQTIAGSAAVGPFVALSARVTDAAIIANDPVLAVHDGAHLTTGAAIGVAVRVLRAGALQVAARADYDCRWTEDLVPARLPEPPRVTGKITTLQPALAAAAALSPYLGVQASAAIAWQRAEGEMQGDTTTVIGGLAGTLALDPLTLLVGGTTERRGQIGVYYAGNRQLDLGGSVVFDLEGPGQRLLGELRVGYYF